MAALAACPNVAMKISGLPMIIHDHSLEKVRPFISSALDLFGVDRCMFASNFPVDKVYVDYKTLYQYYDDATQHLDAEQRQKLFKSNAEKYYRI